ncbi:pyridoxal phosphate-dependent aminotransferase [Leucobacter albus]|uniref:Pyridoxal phosphate-dependent aminotransferase n=1 Tax=Leucobacter albus TaxID=272210 RepID=A0ABW3TQX2_9MICO
MNDTHSAAVLQPRPWLSHLQPYVPGAPAADPDGSLASNENALGPSPRVAAALPGSLPGAERYPDALSSGLVRRIAETHGIPVDTILVGNGSDELIQLLVTAYAAYGGHVVCADPPYQLHEKLPVMLGAEVTKVPLREWAHDLEAMRALAADLAFVCNPHNPTGAILPPHEVLGFARGNRAALTVVDEAYIEYAEAGEGASLISSAARGELAVLRTFSKFYGLAGMRVGFLVADPAIIRTLQAIRLPFSVNSAAQVAAEIALADRDHGDRVRESTRENRGRLIAAFRASGYEVLESQTNFILVFAPDEARLVGRLSEAGIQVRPGSSLGVPGSVRISVPNDAGMAMFGRLPWLQTP